MNADVEKLLKASPVAVEADYDDVPRTPVTQTLRDRTPAMENTLWIQIKGKFKALTAEQARDVASFIANQPLPEGTQLSGDLERDMKTTRAHWGQQLEQLNNDPDALQNAVQKGHKIRNAATKSPS